VIALTDSGTPSQNPQVNVWNDTEQPPSGVENTDEQLAQLEAEMTRIAEERERLQQMQVLADKEAELKRQIAARKAANYGRNPESSP
jgi:predicted nuclease with TOPRIM domain